MTELAHDATRPNAKPDIHAELYQIDLDQVTAIFLRIGDTDTYYEPINLVTFDTDAHAIHYLLSFSELIHRVAERTFTVPDGWPCRKWLAEHSPDSKIDHMVLIMFRSLASKETFEAALST